VNVDDFQYLLLLGACLVVTLPLELLLGARVWRRPRRLLAALAAPAVVFVAWDVVAIARHHWTYNPDYVTGWNLGNLPVEELAFFLVIPICGLLTYEAVRRLLFERDDVVAHLRRLVRRGS
jgi:lycopene beta-cyclase